MTTAKTLDASNLDKWIEELLSCKPLPEADIKSLCEKVISSLLRLRKFLLNSLT